MSIEDSSGSRPQHREPEPPASAACSTAAPASDNANSSTSNCDKSSSPHRATAISFGTASRGYIHRPRTVRSTGPATDSMAARSSSSLPDNATGRTRRPKRRSRSASAVRFRPGAITSPIAIATATAAPP